MDYHKPSGLAYLRRSEEIERLRGLARHNKGVASQYSSGEPRVQRSLRLACESEMEAERLEGILKGEEIK